MLHIGKILISISVALILILFLYNGDHQLLYFLNFINCSISLYGLSLSLSRQKISLALIHWLFNLFFLSIIPLLKLSSNEYIYFYTTPTSIEIIALTSILLWNILFLFTYEYFYNRYFLNFSMHPSNKLLKYRKYNIIICILLCYIFIGIFVAIFGIEPLLFRAEREIVTNESSKGFNLIFLYFYKPLTFFLCISAFFFNKNFSLKFFLLALCLLVNFPTSSARFYLFTLLSCIYVVFFASKEKHGWKNIPYFVAAFFLAAYLHYFRLLTNFQEIFTISIRDVLNEISFNSLHYDAYESFCLGIKYTQEKGFLLGENLLGAFLFFVPRAIWVDKPIPTGPMMIDEGIYDKITFENFDNISFPLIGELFTSFSYPAVIIGALILAILCALLDTSFKLTFFSKKLTSKFYLVIYSILIGLLLFNLRGALMSSFAYTVGLIFSYLLVVRIYGYKIKLKIFKKKNTRIKKYEDFTYRPISRSP